MGTRIKTTIDIADPLFEKARSLAEREGTTLRALVEEGLRSVVDARTRKKPFKLKDGSFQRCRGMSSEFAEGGWERIRSAIYDVPE